MFRSDTARRTLHCRLETPLEDPESRQDFAVPNLIQFVKENRARLATACAIILRAYHLAGRPDMKLPTWGSFEEWSDHVRNPIVWLDLPDPAETRTKLKKESDQSAAHVRMLMAAWMELDPAGRGLTAAEALRLLNDAQSRNEDPYPAARSAFPEIFGDKQNARSVGVKLNHMKKRVCGGRKFDCREKNHTKAWRIVEC